MAANPRYNPSALARQRMLSVVAVVLYPAWVLVLQATVPGVEPNLPGRLVVAALCAALLASTYASAWIRARYATISLGAAFVIVAHNALHVVANHHHPACVIGYVLIVFLISFALDSVPHIAAFVAVATALAFSVGGDSDVLTQAFVASATALALPVCYFVSKDRFHLMRSLEANNEALEASRALLVETQALAKTGGWTATDGVLTLDAQSLAIFGLNPVERVNSTTLAQALTPASAQAFGELLRGASTGRPFDVELELAPPRSLWVRAIGKPEREAGGALRISGAFQDITEHKRMREDLIARESYVRAVVDAIPGPLMWVSDELTYLGVNQAMAGSSSRHTDEFTGREIGFTGDARSAELRAFAIKFFASDKTAIAVETSGFSDASSESTVLLTARKYQDGHAAVIIGTDITRQKAYERGLLGQQELLTQVLDHLPLGVYAKDATANFQVNIWNRRMEILTGIPRAAAIGRTDRDFHPPREADRQCSLDSFVMAGRTLLDVPEETVQSVDGEIPAHTVRVPVFSAGGSALMLLGVVEDIRESKAREALIRSQETQLLQASKMSTLGEMSGGVAHEINNPLAVILGFAQRLESLLEKGDLAPAELARCTARIIAMTDRIARIVRGLRTFAREASSDPFETVPLARIVSDTLELCRQRFLHHGVTLEVAEVPATLVLECRGVQISQVLLNLLGNSFDAVASLPQKWVRIDAEDGGDLIRLIVTDSGSGIPPDLAAKVLNPFFTTKAVGQGTGLGLSISRGLVESHGGKLTYDAAAVNTRFIVELPTRQRLKAEAA